MISKVQSSQEIALVASLAREIWTEYYYPIVGKAQVDYMVPKFQSEESISKQITEEAFQYYLIYSRSFPLGYFAFQYRKNASFLSKIYIRDQCRNLGFGKKVLEFIVTEAKKNGKNMLTLTVNKYNSNSIKIYEKMGFKNVKAIVQDIGEGYVMDDYVMELNF
jgi:ribosomal protein S18 acetylase RimI-like enzyme